MYKYTKLVPRKFTSFLLTCTLDSELCSYLTGSWCSHHKNARCYTCAGISGLMFYDSVIEKKHLDSWPTVNLTRTRHASVVSHTRMRLLRTWWQRLLGTVGAWRAFNVSENDSSSQSRDANSLTGYVVTHKAPVAVTHHHFKHVKPPLDYINLKKILEKIVVVITSEITNLKPLQH